jgi:polysaccharide biosynthesis transport protein
MRHDVCLSGLAARSLRRWGRLRVETALLHRTVATRLSGGDETTVEVAVAQASTVPVTEPQSRAIRANTTALNVMDAALAARVAAQRIQPPSPEIGSLFRLLRRNLAPIILTTIASIGLGVAYLALAKPQYTATSAIFLDPRQRKIVTEDVVPSSGNDVALFESQVSIIGSDTILRRVVALQKLENDSEFAPASRVGLLGSLRERILGPRPTIDPTLLAIDSLAKKLRVRRAQNTYVVNVDVTTDSAVKSASIANAILKAYQDDQASARSDIASRANAMIDGRLDELKAQVRSAEIRADEFKRENRLVTSEGGMLNEQQLTKLNTELSAVRGTVATMKAKLDEMQATLRRGVSPESLPEAMTSPVIQRLREQLAGAARREAALGSQLQARHPAMADARAQVLSLRQQINGELQRIATQTQNDYQLAAGREREIVTTLRGIEGEVAATTTSQIKLRELEREADASREVLRAFLARAKETQEQQNLQVTDARIITPAAVPPRPSSPNAPLVLAFAALSGLALSVLRALLSAGMAPQPTSGPRLTLEGQLGPLRSVGSLPHLAVRRGRFGRQQTASATDLMNALTTGTRTEDLAFRRGVQSVAGRLRAIDRKEAPQIVLLVAGKRAAGTSMSALSIAYVRAMGGEKALLIDASSADPTLSTLFAGELVQDQPCVLDSKDHLLALTTRDTKSGLVFLPIALADLNTLTPNQRGRLATGISKIALDFDVVIIDGGALPEDPGATALAGLATSVVVVSRTGTYDESESQDIVAILGVDPSRVAGVLETMSEQKASE